jgi:hypothetical protein
MLARKAQQNPGKPLPGEWHQQMSELLHKVYRNECQKGGKKFEVYGFLYEDELLVAFSLLDASDPGIIPITCLFSMDVGPHSKMPQLLNQSITSAGHFFDSFFTSREWDDFVPSWQLKEDPKGDFYYRITRENIGLTILADKLLNEPS